MGQLCIIRQLTAPFTAKQERTALLLAAGMGVKAAAAEVGAGERTVHHWLGDGGYRAYVASLRGRLLNEAVGKLADAAGEAVDVLRSLLRDTNPTVRLRAALGILDALVKVRDHAELDERIAALELRVSREEPARTTPEA
jgi:hypothetical protein